MDFDSAALHEAYLVHEAHAEFSKQYFRPNISDLYIQLFQDTK